MKELGTMNCWVVAALACSPLATGCSGKELVAGREPPAEAPTVEDASAPPPPMEGGPPANPVNPAPLTPGSCSSLTWGTQIPPSSDGECATIALGRWQLCDAGASLNLPAGAQTGAGLEFAQENGALDFYVLLADGDGGLMRASALNERGFVDQPSTWSAGACHYWVAPAASAGTEFGWTFLRFKGPDALLINGNVSYVPAP
jgi:hypothetical protein